jgi:hypothetical protein
MMEINDWFNSCVRDRLRQRVTIEEDVEGVLAATIFSVTIHGRRWGQRLPHSLGYSQGVFHVALRRHVR